MHQLFGDGENSSKIYQPNLTEQDTFGRPQAFYGTLSLDVPNNNTWMGVSYSDMNMLSWTRQPAIQSYSKAIYVYVL